MPRPLPLIKNARGERNDQVSHGQLEFAVKYYDNRKCNKYPRIFIFAILHRGSLMATKLCCVFGKHLSDHRQRHKLQSDATRHVLPMVVHTLSIHIAEIDPRVKTSPFGQSSETRGVKCKGQSKQQLNYPLIYRRQMVEGQNISFSHIQSVAPKNIMPAYK